MPLFISPVTGNFTARRVSFGALGDSYYEYLLKLWLLQGRTDDTYRAMWEQVGVGWGLPYVTIRALCSCCTGFSIVSTGAAQQGRWLMLRCALGLRCVPCRPWTR